MADSVWRMVDGISSSGGSRQWPDEAMLDLSQFVAGDTIEFNGYVKLVLEPGATIITGGANIVFSDDAIEVTRLRHSKFSFFLTSDLYVVTDCFISV